LPRLVAVTGGSGFIGTHVVDALLDAGCAVRVLDPKPPHRADAEWVPVDVLDTAGLATALTGSEVIFHLAAVADVNDVIVDPPLAIQVNTLGTARVLEAARRAEAGRVVRRPCGCTPRPRPTSSTRARCSIRTPIATCT
jgi:UDP-glucose 4-epimerase